MPNKRITKAVETKLMKAARASLKNSYSPYSNFSVGAALLTKAGKIYSGVNVENASFGATVCAERSAIFSAISKGEQDFSAIAVVTKSETPALPCGICLQVISEFADPDFIVLIGNKDARSIRKLTLRELLPESFTL